MSEQTPPPTTDDRLDPEFKAKWIQALRSGEFKQAEGILQNVRGCYCCLGVAACLIDPEGWDGREFRGECYLLDKATRDEIGLNGSTQDELADMNDRGESFKSIADWIEANL